MSGDQRLFDYALEPQLQRLRWRLDEELAAVARLVETLATLRADGEAIDAETAALAQQATRLQAERIDPLRARHLLDYLAMLNRRRARVDAEVRRDELQLVDLREALARTQRDIEKLEGDRTELLASHLREVDRRQLREADQDWIARVAWRDNVDAATERST